MLRRKPTQITLTTEDIASYEDRQAQRAALAEAKLQAEMQAQMQAQLQARQAGAQITPQRGQNKDPNDELRPLPVEKRKTRDERLGLGGGSGRN